MFTSLCSKKCFKDARVPKATIVTECDGDITQFIKNTYDLYLRIYVKNNNMGPQHDNVEGHACIYDRYDFFFNDTYCSTFTVVEIKYLI